METNTAKKQPQDVIIIFESSAFINACYDSILENYIKPLVKYFYNVSAIDELGLTKEVNQHEYVFFYSHIEHNWFKFSSWVKPWSAR